MNCPISPDIELTKMKKLENAAIFFDGIVFNKCSRGEKKIPPPIPTNPARNPKPPLTIDKQKYPDFVFVHSAVFNTSLGLSSMVKPAKNRDEPRAILNQN